MTPKIFGISGLTNEESPNEEILANESRKAKYKLEIVWRNVVIFAYIHLAAIYGFYIACFHAKFLSIIWMFFVGTSAGLGITAGAHRLYSHRSYKAKWPMRLILMIFQTVAFQNHIYEWVRDHRVHHKFTDTDADPYNASRGFFFSHVGWLLVRKHPDVINKGATVDCSDLKQDVFVVFQKKWYLYLMPLCCFIVPTTVPWLLWNESLWYAWHLNMWRYCLNLNFTWSVNSAAHIWGMKPYDKSISSANNAGVSFVSFGEGWHNYHHVFPWDYKAAELGNYGLNFTTAFIDFFSYLGLAYDLKAVPSDVVRKRVFRNGENQINDKFSNSIE